MTRHRIAFPLLLSLLALPAPVCTQGVHPDWTYATLGTGIGLSGIVLSPAGGRRELVVGGGASGFGPNRYWVVLAHDATSNSYEQLWASPPYADQAGPVDIEVAELGGKPGPELLVLCANGTLEIWNQQARSLERSFATGLLGAAAMALADVDADQNVDVVAVNGTTMRALTTAGKLLWQVPSSGGYDVVVAQFDGDLALEAVTTNGTVIDCTTQLVDWQWRNQFGRALAAADIDNDQKAELLVAEDSGWIWSYDIDQQLPKWSILANSGGVRAISASDIDLDGVVEVLVGNSQWGEIQAYDSVTQTKEWGIRNPEHGTTRVAWGDPDADGTFEVIWGAGHTSTGKDALYVADWKTLQLEWTSTHLDGPFLGPRVGDVTGDGVLDLVSASATSDAGYSGGRLLLFDAATRKLKHVSQPVGSAFASLTGIELVPFQASPRLDVLVVGDRVRILTWDIPAQAFRLVWELPQISSWYPRVATLRDVQGDARPELVVGSDSDLRVFDTTTKQELWKSFHLASRVQRIEIADTDFDQLPEVHALVLAGDVYVFDAAPLQAKAVLLYQTSRYTSVATSPFVQGEVLLIGDAAGGLTAFFPSGTKYAALGPLPIATSQLDGMEWFFPTNYWCFVHGGSIRLQDGLTPLWMTAPRGAGFGADWLFDPTTNSILAADTQGLVGYRLF